VIASLRDTAMKKTVDRDATSSRRTRCEVERLDVLGESRIPSGPVPVGAHIDFRRLP
jgi:hypothetical protein